MRQAPLSPFRQFWQKPQQICVGTTIRSLFWRVDRAAGFLDNAYWLMTDEVAAVGHTPTVEVQISATDAGGSRPHQDIGAVGYFRVGNITDLSVMLVNKNNALHLSASSSAGPSASANDGF